jgi:hypothetical protein
MPLMEICALHSDSHTNPVESVCGPNTEVLSREVHDIYDIFTIFCQSAQELVFSEPLNNHALFIL